ncbi:MAG TPA: hypothetical protein VMF89_03320 [Polyangiales bacterium]|nr:hypothetical protein [Polyangiales bacterium]
MHARLGKRHWSLPMPPAALLEIDDLALTQLASNSQHCCFALGNIVVTRSLVPPDAAYLPEWTSAILRYGEDHPQGLGLLVLIDENAPPPPGELERSAIKAAYVAVRPVVRCAVQVVEGEGFAAAAKRSVLMIINLATAIGYPIRVTGNVAEATKVLHKLLGPAMSAEIDVAALSRIADRMREQQRMGS